MNTTLALYANYAIYSAIAVLTLAMLAYALYRSGQLDEAATLAEKALALGTKDARIHFHAGAIAKARGRRAESVRLLEEALREDPAFDPTEAALARSWLAER